MRIYQNFTAFIILVFASIFANAQQQSTSQINIISFNVKKTLPADVGTWTTVPGSCILVAQKMPQIKLQGIKLVVQIKRAGAVICGNTSKEATQIDSFTVRNFSASELTSNLMKCPILKAGTYSLCVQFFNIDNYAISREVCKEFEVLDVVKDAQSYSPLQNISPADNKSFTVAEALMPITFRWTPLVPRPKDAVTYRLKVWQLMEGQNASQAMITNGPIVEKDVPNITQTIVANLYTGACTLPYLCDFVWKVQAIDKEGKLLVSSEATEFKISNPLIGGRMGVLPCSTTSTKAYHVGDIIDLSDNFELKLTAEPTGNNDSLVGKGTVDVKWIGVLNVQFKGIRITCNDKIDTGAVYTVNDANQEYPTQWAINVLNNTGIPNWTLAKIKSLAAGIDSNKITKPLIEAADNVTMPASLPLNMPLGYFQHGDAAFGSLGFTEMVFKKDKAEFEVIASLNTSGIFKEPSSFYGTEAIGLQGKGIQFTDEGLKKINGEIKLVSPITFTYAATSGGDLKMTFNTDDVGHIGNSIVFRDTSANYWRYNFDVNVALPKTWLIPVDQAKTNVDLNFQTLINKWGDYILQANIPACTIPNTNGVGFDSSTIVYDHSTADNYSDMVFPANYGTQESSELFSGFYIKSFSVTLPDGLRSYADTTKLIKIGAQDLIINKDGITGKIFAHNILSYPLANVGNLAASIDTVNIELFKTSLVQANMTGKITLPMSSNDSAASAISYNALFIPASDAVDSVRSLTFTLNPDQDIKSKFLGSGKIKIDQTSTLSLVLTRNAEKKREIKLDVDVNGKLYYPGGTIANPVNPSKPFELDLDCKFEHLKMKYENTASEKFTFNAGNWFFASAQKKLSGFAFTIEEVKPIIESFSLKGQYLFKGGLEFVAKINIGGENSKIKIAADAKVQLLAGIKSSNYTVVDGDTIGTKINYGFLTNLKPEFLGVRVSAIKIDVDMAPVSIKGNLTFYKEDITYGNGFKGEISAKFKTPDLSIQVGAIFGNTKYIPGSTTGFKYWMVQAQVKLPPSAAIPFMTGLAVRGFGGGVYCRMNMTPPAVFNPSVAASSTFGGAVFKPDNTVSFGFKAKVIIATYPKEETFNGSIALAAEFNTSGGINKIGIAGLFNCGSTIDDPTKAFANGSITVDYDFPNKIFDLNTDLIVNLVPKGINIFTPTPISTKFYIDGRNNKWYFKSGVPTNPMTVNVFGVLAQSYLMFGNYLGSDIPNGFMPATVSGWNSVGLAPMSFTDNATSQGKYKSAKGFAFGAAVNFSSSNGIHVAGWDAVVCSGVRRYLDIYYNVAAGGEVDASLLQYSGCTGFNNGWRAKVSMAMYAGVDVTYDYNLPTQGCDSHQGTLISIAAGAYATAEFPNTSYFEGDISGYWSVLSGMYSSSFSRHFKKGSQCGGTEIESDPALKENIYKQENAADSFIGKKLIAKIISPGTNLNVNRKIMFSALLNYPYNEAFDVQEQQSSGEMRVRTFRASYNVVLVQDSSIAGGGSAATTSLAASGLTASSGVIASPSTSVSTMSASTAASSISHSTTTSSSSAPTLAIAGSALSATAFIDNTIPLSDACGYDGLGAKQFKLAGSVLSNPALKANTSYKFQVVGYLQEWIGGAWKQVNIKTTTIPIKQTVSYYFKTNSDPVTLLSASSSSIK